MIAFVLAAVTLAADPTLPAEWHGSWAGECRNAGGGRDMRFPMELHLLPLADGKFTFKIVYGSGGKKQVRDYQLIPVKDRPGEFINDERNGIQTDVRLLGGVMHSAFEVSGTLIHSRFELRDAAIHVEMTSYDTRQPRVSRPDGTDLEVKTYRLTTVQSGALKPVKR